MLSRESDTKFFISFHVVKVHKPLLAVSKFVEAGNGVHFDKDDPHILLSTGHQLPMTCNNGTYEVEVWIENPGAPPDPAGFCQAEQVGLNPELVSPIVEDRYRPCGGGRAGIYGADEVMEEEGGIVSEDGAVAGTPEKGFLESVEESCEPRIPHDPRRPTKEERRRHNIHHWPYRSWCKWCVVGRGISSPHRARSSEDREFG